MSRPRNRKQRPTDIDIFAISVFDGVIDAFVEETVLRDRRIAREAAMRQLALYRRAWPPLSEIIGGASASE